MAIGRVEVEFYEDAEDAFIGGGGDGRVRADDGFACDGVAEAHHEVLADGEADCLVWIF